MPVSGGDSGGKSPMGSMWPWRALRPVGNAQRPWPTGPAAGGRPPEA